MNECHMPWGADWAGAIAHCRYTKAFRKAEETIVNICDVNVLAVNRAYMKAQMRCKQMEYLAVCQGKVFYNYVL